MEYTWTLADDATAAGGGDDHENDGPRLRNSQGSQKKKKKENCQCQGIALFCLVCNLVILLIFLVRNDFVGGIDSEALDFSQLEDFINNEDEGEST